MKTSYNKIYKLFFAVLLFSTFSCDKNCICSECAPGYESTYVFYYDSTVVSRTDMKWIYVYELDANGKRLSLDSVDRDLNRSKAQAAGFWNYMSFNNFYYAGPANLPAKIMVVTLKDSTHPVRIENGSLQRQPGNECCKCNTYAMDSVRINQTMRKPSDFPIKIN